MADDRIEEQHDTVERSENGDVHRTTIIRENSDKSSSGGGMFVGIALLLILIVGGFFAFQYLQQDAVETEAISDAANQVGDAAQNVGDAADSMNN